MKHSIQLLCGLLFTTALSFGQSKNERITITGTYSGKEKVVYLQNYSIRTFHVIDSAKVVNGKFEFSKTLPVPEVYGLAVDTSSLAAVTGQNHPDAQTLPVFFYDNKPVTVLLDTAEHFKNARVSGSAATSIYQQFRKSKGLGLEEFIKQHSRSIVPAYILYRTYSSSLKTEELAKYTALIDPSLAQTQYALDLKKITEVAPVGSKFIDFSLPDLDGKQIKLSDKIGKNYVLLEFWASWCPVCRKENPNVVKNYQQYKDKGFDVFGVSLDKNKEAWHKGIQDFGLHWTQVSDLSLWQNSAAQLYGFRALPASILIDPQGNIVAKNLLGEELNKKLEELLQKDKSE